MGKSVDPFDDWEGYRSTIAHLPGAEEARKQEEAAKAYWDFFHSHGCEFVDHELVVHPSAREDHDRLNRESRDALEAWYQTPHFRAEHAAFGLSL